MKKIIFLLALISSINSFSQEAEKQQRPKLVVGIIVDQMRMEYLYRFNDNFSQDGFKRLMKQGFVYQNAHHNHMPTYTAVGHATVYTGANPSIHNIVGNSWFDKKLNKRVYCTDDDSVSGVGGGEASEGKMSPKNLKSSTVTDELKLATNFKGKVFGISIKDRTAILPAGHFADWAFWMSKTGEFISSTYYGKQLPDWVTSFNKEKNFMKYIDKGWDLYKPIATYDKSWPDQNPYEKKLFGVQSATFPYDLKAMYEKNSAEIIQTTPYGNDILVDFTEKAIQNESLGKDNITDFLAISFSSTDYIGHALGSRSMEIEDTYLRLDSSIARLLNYLDKSVGKGEYVVFLTADHGGAENANFLKDNRMPVKNIDPDEVRKGMSGFSKTTFGVDLIKNYTNFNVILDQELIASKGLNLSDVKEKIKTYLESQEQILRVFTDNEVKAGSGNDFLLNMISNAYSTNQSGELFILMRPGYSEYSDYGTSHGSPFSYDTHVPLIFYGWNIKKGESYDKKFTTQIAPTLSQMLKIAFPNGTKSDNLTEVLKN